MSNARFHNRIVYLTGAGSGIGRATAQLFGAEGAKLYCVDVNKEGVDETIETIRNGGGTADGGLCDVSSMESVRASIERAVATYGGLNILVNAAGIGGSVRFEELTEAAWLRTLAVNLNGPFNTAKAALSHLLQPPVGCIVNVASIAGLRGQGYAAHYSASKAGLINLTRSLALEFASRGLRANCICPGGVMTPLISNFIPPEGFESQLISYITPPTPELMCTPEDIARGIVYLASDDARMVSGVRFVMDGGTSA